MYIYAYAYVHTHTYVYIYICTCTYMYIYMLYVYTIYFYIQHAQPATHAHDATRVQHALIYDGRALPRYTFSTVISLLNLPHKTTGEPIFYNFHPFSTIFINCRRPTLTKEILRSQIANQSPHTFNMTREMSC